MRISYRYRIALLILLWTQCSIVWGQGQSDITPFYFDGNAPTPKNNVFPDKGGVTTFSSGGTIVPGVVIPPPPPPPPYTDNSQDSAGGPYSNNAVPATSYPLESNSKNSPNGLEILVAIFFFVAAAWLLVAVFYALLALIVLRLRATGRLDIYDENFGRFHLFGSRFFIQCGCILRRYVVAFGHDQAGHSRRNRSTDYRYISRSERRGAIQEILLGNNSTDKRVPSKESSLAISDEEMGEVTPARNEHEGTPMGSIETGSEHSHSHSSEEPVCSICLAEYGFTESVFKSHVCNHQYHTGCILDWLERRSNTECPCCRHPLVSDAAVWEAVKKARKAQQKQQKIEKKNERRWFLSTKGSELSQQHFDLVNGRLAHEERSPESRRRNGHHRQATTTTLSSTEAEGSRHDPASQTRMRDCNGTNANENLTVSGRYQADQCNYEETGQCSSAVAETEQEDTTTQAPRARGVSPPFDDDGVSDVDDAERQMPEGESPQDNWDRGSRDPEGINASRRHWLHAFSIP